MTAIELSGEEVRRLLALAPRVPDDVSLFSSDSEYCGPGIYPGPPMVPAAHPPVAAGEIMSLVADCSVEPEVSERWFEDAVVTSACPDPFARASLALLGGTIAEPALAALADDAPVTRVGYGTPSRPGRIVGTGAGPGERIISERYRFEHPALLAGPLAHELLCSPTPRCDNEEKFTHGVLAAVHMQLLARSPWLGRLGSELARRVNSLTLSLFNSRPPGDPRFRFVAPGGPGTIPGGAEAMQTPDFWSIPFFSGYPQEVEIPPAVQKVIERLGCDLPAGPDSLSYSTATIATIDESMGLTWLDWPARGRVGRALGVL